MSTSADSAPPAPEETTTSAAPSTPAPGNASNAPNGTPTEAEMQNARAQLPPEVGPMTFPAACITINNHYKKAFNSIQWELDLMLREGALVHFKPSGVNHVIAIGKIWISPRVTFDNDNNASAVVGVRDLVYPS